MKQRNISKGIYSLYVIMFMLMIPIGDLWAQDPLNISGKVFCQGSGKRYTCHLLYGIYFSGNDCIKG